MKKPCENWGACQEAQGESTSWAQKFAGPEIYQLLSASEEVDGKETTGMGQETTLKTVSEVLQNLLKLFKGTTLSMSTTICSFISLGKKELQAPREQRCAVS